MNTVQCRGVIFDLDGVVTRTAKVHALAWEKMFNEFLRKHAEEKDEPFKPFDPLDDYQKYVDGKPRFEGVLSFLDSRNIKLPYGEPDDPATSETVHGLGTRKNILFQEILRREGPEVIQTTVDFIRQLLQRDIHVAIASSSRNCKLVLELAGLEELFEVRVDGEVSRELSLKGKPDPDIFITAARQMGLWPSECVVVEDALSGVQAGKNGNFGLTLGIARNTDGQLLLRFGADIIVQDLSEISFEDIENWFDTGVREDGWHLTYRGFDPGDERLRETLTTVGNGYLGTRGCFEGEKASFSFYPGTYIAGIYNRVPSELGGRTIYNNDFVNCPNWLPIEFKIGSGEFTSPLSMDVLSYSHNLNMRDALMERTIVCRDKLGRITRIQSTRLASMDDPHLCAIRYEFTPLNYSSRVTIRSSLDGNVKNEGVPRYRQLASQHLDFVSGGKKGDGVYLHVQTSESRYQILMQARTVLYENGRQLTVKNRLFQDEWNIGEDFELRVQENANYAVEKIVSVSTSHDSPRPGESDYKQTAAETLRKAKSFQEIAAAHRRAWERLWDTADILITGDRFVQKIIRLHTYHLLVTASPHNTNLDAGMPARGLHGEAYRGHIFWDELYILPFYIHHFPEVARSLLLYRYRRLDAAREYARENGYEGAMYPWQTADDGLEDTQEIHYNPESKTWGPDLSRRQRHVSIAVFYNFWRYISSSRDMQFFHEYGAEVMLEIARFWANIARYDETSGKYHIEGVMGPDEFHEKLPDTEEPGLKDNAYTNMMVVWLLEKMIELVPTIPNKTLEGLKQKTAFQEKEIETWKEIAESINVIINDEGVISQFAGYMQLKELDWEYYRKRYYSIHRMDRILKAEGDSPDRYKVAKQADVLMIFYILAPEKVGEVLKDLGYTVENAYDLMRTNYNYYEPRTSHGSTLSRVVHAVISSFIHVDDRPWNWFMDAMKSDIYDTQGGTTQEGIHTGVMAGTIDVILRCFARVNLLTDPIEINPRLPAHWMDLSFKICHQKRWYDIVINKRSVKIRLSGPEKEPALIRVLGKDVELTNGEQINVRVSEAAAEKWLKQQYLMLTGEPR
ncbi:MAG: beta-phosphoglucomutase family hydrolase [Desulfovibrionales bacterium]